jgi:predicted ribosome quality control (RQC) complex YloA/Tae2 family protein
MDSQEITWILQELQPALLGARVQKARDDGEHTLALTLRAEGQTRCLILSIDAARARLHLAPDARLTPSWRRRLRDGLAPLTTPTTPQTFTATARSWLSGKALIDITQAPNDRLVRLTFQRVTPDAHAPLNPDQDQPIDASEDADASEEAPERCALLCAFMGTRANLWLLDDAGRCLPFEPARKAPPPAALLALTAQDTRTSPSTPSTRAQGAQDRQDLAGPRDWLAGLPINRLVYEQGEAQAEAAALSSARGWVSAALGRALKKQRRLVGALSSDLQRASAAEQDKVAGDLLSAHFHMLRRGQPSVTVPNLFSAGEPITIALDPTRKPSDNIAKYYQRYRKYSAAQDKILARLLDAEARAEALTAAAAALASVAAWPDLEAAARRCLDARLLAPAQLIPGGASARAAAKAKARPSQRLPYKVFISRTGQPIWVGRGAADNDALTLRHARGHDLWLHAVGWPGSHVIVRLTRDQHPDQDTLLDAATLAAHFSKGRTDSLIEVHHARCKFIRKPKGAPAGAVQIQGASSVIPLRLDPDRLQRLLAQAPD